MESVQGVLDGVRRGAVGPLGPLELAAQLLEAWRIERLSVPHRVRVPPVALDLSFSMIPAETFRQAGSSEKAAKFA
jgi:hypothetical protein